MPPSATLCGELVDYGFMSRSGGVYRVAHWLPTPLSEPIRRILDA